MRRGNRVNLAILLAVASALWGSDLRAQTEVADRSDRTLRSCAGISLDADHWGLRVTRRLTALGLVDEAGAQRALSLCTLSKQLQAAEFSSRSIPETNALIVEWQERLGEEYPGLEVQPDPSNPARLIGLSAGIQYLNREGFGAPGLGEYPPARTGVIPLDDRSRLLAELDLAVGLSSHVGLRLSPAISADGLTTTVADLTANVGPVSASIGRGDAGYGYSRQGAVVLSGGVPLDRIQVETSRPLHPGGLIRFLGSVDASTFIAAINDDRHPNDPKFWGASVSFRPHSRTTVAINRAALFAGTEENDPVSATDILRMLVGSLKGIGFEDQVVSVSARYRIPSERLLPLTAYMEWGAEDAAGSWHDVPGRIIGIEIPAVPRYPQLAVGAEYSRFAGSCCGNPPWYRHWSFPGAWALGDQPLGHGLGGEGSEMLLFADVDPMFSTVRISGEVFTRDRGLENLYVPGREGRSFGGSTRASIRIGGAGELQVSGALEEGHGWSDRSVNVTSRIFLGP